MRDRISDGRFTFGLLFPSGFNRDVVKNIQRLHKTHNIPGNDVTGTVEAGTYLGSSDIEGFQAGNFIQILDNQAAQWLLQLTTGDGTTLGGFASLADRTWR